MKLLLPLLAATLLVTACTSPDMRRPLWAEADLDDSYRTERAGGRSLWASAQNDVPYRAPRADGRVLWGPEMPIGYSDPNVTRRYLYSDARGTGPYSNAIQDGSWRYYGKPADQEMRLRREEQQAQKILNKAPAQSTPPAPVEPAPM